MIIKNEKPPEWIMSGCLNKFRLGDISRTYWTYGDTIYNPGGLTIVDHVMVHEEQHSIQQRWDYLEKYVPPEERTAELLSTPAPDYWWKKYLSEPRFRLEQEAEAYGAQYKFFCLHVKDRNKRDKFVRELSSILAGPLYQVACNKEQARAMILVLSGHRKLEQIA